MKIEIHINKRRLSNLQVTDLLQDLNELNEGQLRSIINGKVFESEIGADWDTDGVALVEIIKGETK